MSCEILEQHLPLVIKELYLNRDEEGIPGILNRMYKEFGKLDISTYFEPNTKSNTKLADTDISGNNVVRTIGNAVQRFVKNSAAVSNETDLMLINPTFQDIGVHEGFQSVIALTYKRNENSPGYTINKNVAKAISIATNDWLATIAEPTLPEHRSNEDIRNMLGLDKKTIITKSMRDKISGFDSTYASAVNMIGTKSYKLLGIKASKGNDAVNTKMLEAKFKTELGLLAIRSLENDGYLKIGEADIAIKDDEENIAKIISFTKKSKFKDANEDAYLKIGSKLDKRSSAQLYDSAVNIDNKHGVYSTKELAVPSRNEIINDGISGMIGDVVSSDNKNAVIKQSSTPYKFRKAFYGAINILQEELGSSGNISLLEEILGAKDPANVIVSTQDAVRGKNNMISDSIKYIDEAYQEFGSDTEMYAKWKVITNNRFMIDSNKLNWQDKKLHRYSVYNRESVVNYSDNDITNKLFKLILGQAFDLPVDKKTAKTLLDGKDSIIEKTINDLSNGYDGNSMAELEYGTISEYEDSPQFKKDLKDLVQYAMKNHSGMFGEPEHAISGLVELLRYNYAVAHELEFKTGIMLETDAITSGYGIKNMQAPILYGKDINAQIAELEKVGVFTSDKSSYGQRVEDGNEDSYEEPAKELTNALNSSGVKVPSAILKLIDPKIKMDGEKIIKISRNFMKNPFMVLNYGSSIRSIVKSTARIAENEFYSKVNEYYSVKKQYAKSKEGTSESEKLKQLGSELRKELENIGVAIGNQDYGRVFTKTKDFRLHPNELKKLNGYIIPSKYNKNAFGAVLEKVLSDKYKPFIGLTENMNEIFTFQFRLAKNVLDRKIREAYNEKVKELIKDSGSTEEQAKRLVAPITEKEITGMVQDLSDVFPVLNSILDTDGGIKSRLFIAKKRKASGADGDVELLGNVSSPGLRLKNKTIDHSQMEVYKLIEAYSSGAVVPIHYFDGSVQAKVLSKFTALGVHDANYFNIDDIIDGTREYNKQWLELNKDYHLVHETMQSFVRTMQSKEITSGDLDVLSTVYNKKDYDYLEAITQHLKQLHEAEVLSENNRAEIFSKKLNVQHAYAEVLDGSGNTVSAKYEYKPSDYDKKITPSDDINKIIKTIITKDLSTNIKKDAKIATKKVADKKTVDKHCGE